eukprot:scaffold167525_cov48-Attheya_sp.AAC.1
MAPSTPTTTPHVMVEVVAMVDVEEGADEEATVVVDEEEEATAVNHPFAVVGEAAVTMGEAVAAEERN